MHLYPEEHILYGDYALEAWDPKLVQSLLNLMVPDNMRLDIVTKSFDLNNAGMPFLHFHSDSKIDGVLVATQ